MILELSLGHIKSIINLVDLHQTVLSSIDESETNKPPTLYLYTLVNIPV